jgi:hypothetical protein
VCTVGIVTQRRPSVIPFAVAAITIASSLLIFSAQSGAASSAQFCSTGYRPSGVTLAAVPVVTASSTGTQLQEAVVPLADDVAYYEDLAHVAPSKTVATPVSARANAYAQELFYDNDALELLGTASTPSSKEKASYDSDVANMLIWQNNVKVYAAKQASASSQVCGLYHAQVDITTALTAAESLGVRAHAVVTVAQLSAAVRGSQEVRVTKTVPTKGPLSWVKFAASYSGGTTTACYKFSSSPGVAASSVSCAVAPPVPTTTTTVHKGTTTTSPSSSTTTSTSIPNGTTTTTIHKGTTTTTTTIHKGTTTTTIHKGTTTTTTTVHKTTTTSPANAPSAYDVDLTLSIATGVYVIDQASSQGVTVAQLNTASSPYAAVTNVTADGPDAQFAFTPTAQVCVTLPSASQPAPQVVTCP